MNVQAAGLVSTLVLMEETGDQIRDSRPDESEPGPQASHGEPSTEHGSVDDNAAKALADGDGVQQYLAAAGEAPPIATYGLTKFYGRRRGVEDVSFEVRAGEIFGFLGPNGSGKSTTIRLLVDLLRPSSGSARIFGQSPRHSGPKLRHRIGYLPGDLALNPNMTGERLLGYYASMRGMQSMRSVNALSGRFRLDLSGKIGQYSTGNRQKVGIVQAFMHDPELLILDEPTSGLDPLMQHEFYALLEERRARGRTVMLSSHLLPEVERVADRVAIIAEGQLQVVEEVQVLKARARRRLELHFLDPVPVSVFRRLFPVRAATANTDSTVISLQVEGPVDEVIKAAAAYRMANIVSYDGDLEEIVLRYYRRPPSGPKRITVAPGAAERRRDDTMQLQAITRDDAPPVDTAVADTELTPDEIQVTAFDDDVDGDVGSAIDQELPEAESPVIIQPETSEADTKTTNVESGEGQ